MTAFIGGAVSTRVSTPEMRALEERIRAVFLGRVISNVTLNKDMILFVTEDGTSLELKVENLHELQ